MTNELKSYWPLFVLLGAILIIVVAMFFGGKAIGYQDALSEAENRISNIKNANEKLVVENNRLSGVIGEFRKNQSEVKRIIANIDDGFIRIDEILAAIQKLLDG